MQKEIAAVDNDVKSKFSQYTNTKNSLATAQRAHTGNLSQKSLASIVNPDSLLKLDQSEYLQQHLVAVPTVLVKDFMTSYESVAPMVVPRSALLLAKDEEFQLYAVTVFKKHSTEFVHKCREHRWTPRDMKFTDGGREAEEQELRKLEKEERKLWGEALKMGRTGYSDAVMDWVHVLSLRVFVETVLRYGLPLSYACGIIKAGPMNHGRGRCILTFDRPTANAAKRPKHPWTHASRISAATHSAKTRKADQKRMTAISNRKWLALGLAARLRGSKRTFFTSLRSSSDRCRHETALALMRAVDYLGSCQ